MKLILDRFLGGTRGGTTRFGTRGGTTRGEISFIIPPPQRYRVFLYLLISTLNDYQF